MRFTEQRNTAFNLLDVILRRKTESIEFGRNNNNNKRTHYLTMHNKMLMRVHMDFTLDMVDKVFYGWVSYEIV